jgi:hypothetical protein
VADGRRARCRDGRRAPASNGEVALGPSGSGATTVEAVPVPELLAQAAKEKPYGDSRCSRPALEKGFKPGGDNRVPPSSANGWKVVTGSVSDEGVPQRKKFPDFTHTLIWILGTEKMAREL